MDKVQKINVQSGYGKSVVVLDGIGDETVSGCCRDAMYDYFCYEIAPTARSLRTSRTIQNHHHEYTSTGAHKIRKNLVMY